ncbi:MAG: hypothetical protein ABI234_04065 [Ktedonobacteraceae bacterium]
MICAKCGANNPGESTFCGGCGSSLTPMQRSGSAGPVFSEPATWAASDNAPTLRTPFEQPFVPQQPTPLSNEFLNVGTPSQGRPEPTPAPGYPSGMYQGQAPTVPGSLSGANYPAPGAPGMPSYPSGANYPAQGAAGMPGYPSGANYPTQNAAGTPSYPSGANYPAQGAAGMPGYPSGANYPAQGAAGMPGYPSGMYPPITPMPGEAYPGALASGAYPGQPSQPNWGGYPGMVQQQPVAQPSKLIQPMPFWVTTMSSIIVAAVLAALMFFTGADWAAGAQTAGIISLVLGLLMLIAFGVRGALGMLAKTNTHRMSQVVSAVFLMLLLFGYGAFGLTAFGQSAIHTLQAHTLEGQQKWQSAIDEYNDSTGGQKNPASIDVARTYNEWGLQLSSQQHFDTALTKFNTVMTDYSQANAQVTQAQSNAILAYQGWGNQAAQQTKYADATQHFDELLTQLYCGVSCKNSTKTLDATAYFNLGEQKLAAGDFSSAVSAFTKLTTDANLKDSSSATKAHGDYAKALLGEGKQALTTTCSSAVPIYQQLSTSFSDTPEGQQATQALAAPVSVKGHFTTTIPSGTNVSGVGLVQGLTQGMASAQFYPLLANSPQQLVHSDGTFSFPSIKQGSYDMVWGVVNTTSGQGVYFVSQRYPAVVAPLCAFDFGDINEAFPTP